ncbi:hypothetical protein SASPL_120043 [Salvia splendens]|uniref:Uncharacterized protein n=1 Tax=Salvia splendens TaxID=180675 RepID=A0A8X8XQ17_SALSN|nr:hypothetical protein SASPL_120043 [Salvia splendens]
MSFLGRRWRKRLPLANWLKIWYRRCFNGGNLGIELEENWEWNWSAGNHTCFICF